jgi:uncharacterized membrane protein YfhO
MLDPAIENDVELSGQGLFNTTEKSCNSLAFDYAGDRALARINTYYFPGWTAYIDGKKTVSQTDESGLIVLDIPEGHHRILLKFEDTPIRRASAILSLFAATVLVLQMARAYAAASKYRES